ncbi:MAG: hydantoinase/carbamoylase family amidase [Acidimicrobiales bacterium]
MVEIDGARLLERLQTLRGFGAVGTGVVRPTYSDIDMAARRWLVEQMEGAGLSAAIDGVGNVFGRSPNPGPTLVLGSHSDTQPEGGWLDGAMGVIYGIEVAQALREDPATSQLAVDVAAWADEEGTYNSCLGSRSFVGEFGEAQLASRNGAGESVREALDRVGIAGRPTAAVEPDRHVGYIEAHIEQGPHLEASGRRIGVVSSIVGIRAMEITFAGEQNHAGSTPMARRRDAGAALFDYGVRLRARFTELAGPTSVWTIGNVRFDPGAESIIPGAAWCVLQFRDPDPAILDAFQAAAVGLADELSAEGPVAVSAGLAREAMAPVAMDGNLRSHLRAAAADRAGDQWVDMPSAAVHDGTVLAPHLPCAMVFIPSINGVSHDFAEDSHHDDIVLGCAVLADAVARALGSASP